MNFCCFLLIILTSSLLFAQTTENKPWTLQECIEYALKNNIQIKQNRLNERLAEANLLQTKAQMLPSLNGSISHSYNNGKKVDPFTNQFITGDWIQTQNYSLSANVTLFSGFQTLNTIRQTQYELMANRQDVLRVQNDISLNIASAYLQILFAEELLASAQSQLEVTNLHVDRIRKMVEAGALPKGNLLDIQAQQAIEQANVVNAENNLTLASLNLMQMLNLDTIKNFRISRPEFSIQSETIIWETPSQIYDAALSRQPEIKAAEFRLKSAEKGIAVAKGAMLPRLTFNASYGTGYSGASKDYGLPVFSGYVPNGSITSGGDTVYEPYFTYDSDPPVIPFKTQIDNNLNRSLSFFVTVPLFNNFQTQTAITRAKIARENAALALQLEKNTLRQKIQQAYNDAEAALKKYFASKKAVEAMEESFRYMDQKYTVGTATSIEYNDSKNKLAKAKSDLMQAKYDYVFKLKVLDFYQGKPITL